jgi:transcriptional regulator GlxA family with amidase domain
MSTIRRSPPAAGTDHGADAIELARRHIEEHFCERMQLEALATIARLSVFRFATVFRRRIGVPPYRYVCNLRVERARALLRAGLPPAIVAGEAGFYDQSHLTRHFKNVCGMTPGQYRVRVRDGSDPESMRPTTVEKRAAVRV